MVQKQSDLIKLSSPDIRDQDIELAIDVIKSGNLVEGKFVSKFEDDLSKFIDIPYSCAVSSATAGLHLAVKALGIKQGDCVIVPTFTFPATANVVENVGAEVLFCDVDIDTYVINSIKLEEVINNNKNKNLKAIIVVHEFGYPADMKDISGVAKKYNLKLIEDAACALGSFSQEKHVGHYSDIAVFSFHPRKAITSGEGGVVVSNDKKAIDCIRILKNHGIVRNNESLDFIDAGLNYRMTDFQAALLIGQLARFDDELKKRKELVEIYFERLANSKNIKLPKYNEGHSWQSFMVVLNQEINRNKLIEFLLAKNIQTNLGAQSLPMLTYYNKKYNLNKEYYINSEILFKQGLVLPLYGKIKLDQTQYICDTVISYLVK